MLLLLVMFRNKFCLSFSVSQNTYKQVKLIHIDLTNGTKKNCRERERKKHFILFKYYSTIRATIIITICLFSSTATTKRREITIMLR